MKNSVCVKVHEALPLYVGGDLPNRRARRVAEHLRDCAPCLTSAEQLREARESLKLYTTPAFDEQVFSQIRAAVLREITTPERTPESFAVSWWRKYQWPAFATSLALLILSVTLISMFPLKPFDRQDAASSVAPVTTAATAPSREESSTNAGEEEKAAPKKLAQAQLVTRKPARPIAEHRRERQRLPLDSVEVGSTGVTTAYQLISPTLPIAPVSQSEIGERILEPAQLRIELQTNNSQIGIIQLPPPELK